jgi:alpha-tubulin suppressor-like RCC1 family protein
MTTTPTATPASVRRARAGARVLLGGLVGAWSAAAPLPARAESSAPDVAVGYAHACARKADGTLWCWGANDSGQLGDGTITGRLAPARVTALGGGVAEVSAGDLFTCARKTDGTLWCWGGNAAGQLGNGTTDEGLVPAPVTALGDAVAEISAADLHACARKTDGTLWCWGAGLLGDGGSDGSLVPVQVAALGATVAEVSTGDGASCARKTDGTLWCWGDNTFGIVGDGTTDARPTPVPVTALGSDVAGVSAGDLFACARKADGTAWCWGTNDHGQLGDGTTASHFAPAQTHLPRGSVVEALSVNGRHACALLAGSGLWCWGGNASGELGDGTTTDRPTPVPVTVPGGGVVEVAAGINHETCSAGADGSVFCWGENGDGQIGDGTTIDRSAPVRVLAGTTPVPAAGPWGIALLAAGLATAAARRLRGGRAAR